MTQEQEFKLQILKEVCSMREYSLADIALFMQTPLDGNIIKDNLALNGHWDHIKLNGVYICYADGRKELWNGTNSKENVSHIGIKLGDFQFGLQLHDKGEYQLLRDGVRCPETAGHYTRGKRNAFEDFDAEAGTARIIALGTDIPLADGELIPTAGQWGIMMMFASAIQEALAYVGGDPLTDEDWYWSVTEHSQNNAWGVYFNDGNTYYNTKYYSHRVRAVVAF